MKKYFVQITIAIIFSMAVLVSCKKNESVGDGTKDKPFIVRTVNDLKKVGNSVADGWTLEKHYKQAANITLNSKWYPIGVQSDTPFTGSYDGGGYSITGLNSSSTGCCQGLFGYIGTSGAVRNVALLNVSVITENMYAGGIASVNNGTIENCYVTGSISAGSRAGGVAGENRGKISNCYTTCNVTTNGILFSGGITGCNSSGTVSYCYATGKINGRDFSGGIVGGNARAGNSTVNGSVQHCVALNTEVSATTSAVGRITGNTNSTTSTLTYNYAREVGMTLKSNGNALTPSPGVNDKDGANISAENTHGSNSSSWWQSAGYSATFWSFANDRLPHLKTTTGEAFIETQTPAVQ